MDFYLWEKKIEVSKSVSKRHFFFFFKVLNETSLWWFDKTRHITSNAVVSSPDKNVTIAKKCSVFPVEFVGELLEAFWFIFSFGLLTFYFLGVNYTNAIEVS